MTRSADPVGRDWLQASRDRRGNITGLTICPHQLSGKRLELLKETFPIISSVVILVRRGGANYTPFLGTHKKLRSRPILDVQVETLWRYETLEIRKRFLIEAKRRAAALYSNRNPLFTFQRERIAMLRKEAGYRECTPERVRRGGRTYVLWAKYACSAGRHPLWIEFLKALSQRASVEQPTKFELVINLKTAKESVSLFLLTCSCGRTK